MAPGDLARLTLVMFLWAACFPLIAAGLSLAPPLYFAALRSFVAGAGLLGLAFALRRPMPQGWRVWLSLLSVGLSATGLGFGGMFLAGGVVSPGLATVIANAQPLIAAGLAYFILGERLGPRRRVGLMLGFAGIVLIAMPGFGGANPNSTPGGVGYVLLGALGVAAGNVLFKRLVGQVDLLMATGWQFILGGIPLLLAALSFEQAAQVEWGLDFVIVLLALGLLGTALAFALWFSLLRRGELNRLNTFTFLTPAFALLIGAVFFGERLGLVEVGGIILTLIGVLRVI
ncbi:MAG: EamA/RhaT family transporter [Anaerolineae bacterium]|nr:EamA/RhaT family transporter [Anaerolineae bacterium]